MYHIGVAMLHPPLPDPSQISADCLDFLNQCFIRSPKERPTPSVLLLHPFVKDLTEGDIAQVMSKQYVNVTRIQDTSTTGTDPDSFADPDGDGMATDSSLLPTKTS
jgi:mitogen-activated protein kinase kinase kinase